MNKKMHLAFKIAENQIHVRVFIEFLVESYSFLPYSAGIHKSRLCAAIRQPVVRIYQEWFDNEHQYI